MHNVKYLSPSFDDDVLFVLSLVSMGVPSAYGCSIDGINMSLCDSHLSFTTKTTYIQKDFRQSFKRSYCASHLHSINKHHNYMYQNVGVSTDWIGLIFILFFVEDVFQKNQNWNVRYVTPHQCVLRCVMLLQYTSTLHPLRCRGLVYILMFMVDASQ